MQNSESNGRVKMQVFKRLKKDQDELSPDRYIRRNGKV